MTFESQKQLCTTWNEFCITCDWTEGGHVFLFGTKLSLTRLLINCWTSVLICPWGTHESIRTRNEAQIARVRSHAPCTGYSWTFADLINDLQMGCSHAVLRSVGTQMQYFCSFKHVWVCVRARVWVCVSACECVSAFVLVCFKAFKMIFKRTFSSLCRQWFWSK